MSDDSFQDNINGVAALIGDPTNKVSDQNDPQEGLVGEFEDALDLKLDDEELLTLRDQWENDSSSYTSKVKTRQDKNKLYYTGKQGTITSQDDKVVASNLLFEAEETFIPQALSQNPEPVVFSDNTEEGKDASNDLKTMLQYHADVLCLRKKLGVLVRHWSIYFVGVVKHGWDDETNDIKLDIRKPQNFILDPNGFVDEFGDYKGQFLGERIESSAKQLIEQYPSVKGYIFIKVNGRMGTKVTRTEWWTDKYCFVTYGDKVLDKYKNPFFNYPTEEKPDEEGNVTQSATPGLNHFAIPKMPYTFLSVFSLQETPHDITNLIEQNIPNQDRITDRDMQISKNLASANNGMAISGTSFTAETASQAVQTFYDEGFLLMPTGDMDGVKRIPANDLPSAIFQSQENDKETLRSVFGTQGLTSQPQNEQTTARGMILNQSHDASRIGGGVGDALEQVADNIFNWWTQLYAVFYDIPHYGAIMGNGQAVEYTNILNTHFERHFVVSVSPDSMTPKDEISETNQAIQLADSGWLDPINLFKKLNYPDPMNTAKMVTLFKINPQLYAQTFFPEANTQAGLQPQPPTGEPAPVEQGTPPGTLSAPPASASLSQVPINTQSLPQ